MKALITGGNGFIGSHLVELLLRKNYSVRCLVRTTSDLSWINHLPIDYVFGDLFDRQALHNAVVDVDHVYHSAGVTKARTKEEYFRGNATGTRNILDAAMSQGKAIRRFIHVSSQAAVGPSESRTPITEETSPHPLTSYGKSKWQAEEECLKSMHTLPITIVRLPVVYGPRDKDVFEFFHTMSKGLQPMVGFAEKYVSMLHVEDVVRGIAMAGESETAAGQTYFISSSKAYGWREIGDATRAAMKTRALRVRIPETGVYVIATVAEALARLSSKPALINLEKARDMVQNYWTCDSSKAKRDFGFEQQVSLEQGIATTVAWYRQQGWL